MDTWESYTQRMGRLPRLKAEPERGFLIGGTLVFAFVVFCVPVLAVVLFWSM